MSLLRERWDDCEAILQKSLEATDAEADIGTTDDGKLLRGALAALWQATTERLRGGSVNTPGGRA